MSDCSWWSGFNGLARFCCTLGAGVGALASLLAWHRTLIGILPSMFFHILENLRVWIEVAEWFCCIDKVVAATHLSLLDLCQLPNACWCSFLTTHECALLFLLPKQHQLHHYGVECAVLKWQARVQVALHSCRRRPSVLGCLTPDLLTKLPVYGVSLGPIHFKAAHPWAYHRGWPGVGFTHSLFFGVLVATLVLWLSGSRAWFLGLILGTAAHVLT